MCLDSKLEDKVLRRMIPSTPWLQSALNFLINFSFTDTSEIGTVCIFTTLWAGRARNCGLVPGRCKIFFSFTTHPDRLLFNTYHGFYPRLKRLGREADHWNRSSTEIRNEWSYTATPSYVFMSWTGTKFPLPLLPSLTVKKQICHGKIFNKIFYLILTLVNTLLSSIINVQYKSTPMCHIYIKHKRCPDMKQSPISQYNITYNSPFLLHKNYWSNAHIMRCEYAQIN